MRPARAQRKRSVSLDDDPRQVLMPHKRARATRREGTLLASLAALETDLDAKPAGWLVGQPIYHEHRRDWERYAFDTREKAKAGHRSREWTAVAQTELEVVREMARCLREISDG
jgi:hypothetical protein